MRLIDEAATAADGLLAAVRALPAEHRGRSRQFGRGDVMFLQGSASGRAIVLHTGVAKACGGVADGREVTVELLGPGNAIGLLSNHHAGVAPMTIQAITQVEAEAFDLTAFQSLAASRPQLGAALVGSLAARLAAAHQRHRDAVVLDSLGRVAAQLAALSRRFGVPCAAPESGIVIDVPISQRELAGLAGCSIESTSKALATLRRLGHLETGRRRFVVLDPAGLDRVCEPQI